MAKITLDLAANAGDLLNDTNLSIQALAKLADQSKKTRKTLSDDFTAAGKAGKEFNTAVDAGIKTLSDQAKAVEAFRSGAKQLDDIAKKRQKEPTIWESLFGNLKNNGNSALSKEQLDGVISTTGKVATAVKQNLTAVLTDLVAAEQRYINVLDKRIAKQEDVVARQQELENQRIVNSLGRETDKLNKLNEAREKALKKQKAVQAAQAAIDTATQLSSLVTAAAQVFAAYSGIIGGTVIAPVLVAAMFAAFAAAKVTAGVLASKADGFRKGGYTGDGDPSQTSTVLGSRGYRYHKKEFVFNEEKTARYRNFFEALHRDDRSGIIQNISDLLSGTGVSVPDRNLPQKLMTARTEYDNINRSGNNDELKALRYELIAIKTELKDWKNRPVERSTGIGNTLITKKGNRTIIKKGK
jgi:hypothetical protein